MKDAVVQISVIVTIHNAEKYINECLDSVLSQTFPQIEVLCVDGGSTDATPGILRQYAAKDDRIRIIDDPNTSYGHKVNRGMEEAAGEYLAVLESDDMYEPYMLETLYEAAERHQADFANGNYTEFYDVNGRRFRNVVRMYPDGNYNRVMDYVGHSECFGVIPRYWTGLFRRAYLEREGIRMNESPGASYQDMSFRFLTSILARRAYHLDTSVYLYRIDNPGSSMHDQGKAMAIAEEHVFLQQELRRRGITDRHVWHNAYQWKYMDFRGNMRRLQGHCRQELFGRYLEELEKDREALARYGGMGYDAFASEMMTGTPEAVARMVEEDATAAGRAARLFHGFLDAVTRPGGDIVVFGCGQRGDAVLELLQPAGDRICCLTDNRDSLWNSVKCGYTVLPPEEAVGKYPDAVYVVANKFHTQDIVRQLSQMGIPGDRICVYERG